MKNRDHIIFNIFWIVMYFVFLLQIISQASVVEALVYPLLFCISAYYITKHLSLTLLGKAIISKQIFPFIFQFIACSLTTAFLAYIYRYLFFFLDRRGIFDCSSFFDLEYGFTDFAGAFLSVGIIINLCFCGVGFYLAYSKLEKQHLEAQLQMLQAQITPHFMFNILHHINILIQKDTTYLASELLIKYANILRYQLYSGKEEFVSIGQEIQFLKEFIDVETIRWKNNLNVTCKWDIENKELRISPLLLIVFVENAFKHVSRTTTEKGYIHIQFRQKGNGICFTVENSKSLVQPKAKKNSESGIGLINIRRRLNILYPQKHTFSIKETGTTYSCRLQINI